MRKTLWIILTVLAMAIVAPTVLRADDITYSVNLTVGAGSVIGTITTDGTIGTLATSDILDWNLILNDGTTTVTLTGPPAPHISTEISGSDVTATATALSYNFSGPNFDFFIIEDNNFTPTGGGVLDFFTPDPADSTYPNSGINVSHLEGSALTVNDTVSGTQVIGSVIAPEPATLALMLPAIGFLLATRKRMVRGRQ